MKYHIEQESINKVVSDCLLVAIHEDDQLSESAKTLDDASNGYIQAILANGDLEGKIEQCLLLPQIPNCEAKRVLLVGCGKKGEIDARAYANILRCAFTQLQKTNAKNAVSYLFDCAVKSFDTSWQITQAIIANEAARYTFNELKSKAKPGTPLESLHFAIKNTDVVAGFDEAIAQGQAIASGMNYAKDLGNRPGNICTPSYLAQQAEELGKNFSRIKTSVLDEKQMEALKMGAFLSVSRGSTEPGKLITMSYEGADSNTQPIVLVGKGITFDSGGISIKPAGAMDEMKFDMCGAASVFGVLKAVAELGLPLNVIGIVASAENLPSGSATKPGDIVTTMSGQTVEILNTDAEGRLVLCDALTYSEKFNPEIVIDIATLTGAMVVALGHHVSGMMANNEELAQEILQAGRDSQDRVWQLPMDDDYQKDLDSNFADMANVGSRWGGAITAACYLSRFTEKLKWAHLDVAGTAFSSGKAKGATGRPVPLLMQYLINRTQ